MTTRSKALIFCCNNNKLANVFSWAGMQSAREKAIKLLNAHNNAVITCLICVIVIVVYWPYSHQVRSTQRVIIPHPHDD